MKLLRFSFYFLLIVSLGGLGCWISLGQYLYHQSEPGFASLMGNLGTFTISVAFTAFADYLLNPGDRYQATRSLGLLLLAVAAAAGGILAILLTANWVKWIAIIAAAGAVTEWVIVNLENRNFGEHSDPRTMMGGPING